MIVKKLKVVFVFLLFFFIIHSSYSLITLTVTEGDLVKLNTTVQDPDQDDVFIYYSPPLNDSGEWQTSLNDEGTYHTTVIASDGLSQTEEEITIIVKNKNQAPEIMDKQIIVEETEVIDLKQLISDPDNDTLKLIFEEPFDKEGIWQTTPNDAGTYQTEIIASDLEYKTTQTIEIKVKDKNQIPEMVSSFSENRLVQITEDTTFFFSASVNDQDKDTLTYFWQLDGKEISRSPSFNHYFDFDTAGEHILTLTVSDQKSELNEDWTLEIENVNRPPEIELPEIIINEGEKIVLQLPETDKDGDTITYSFQPPFEDGEWQTTYSDAGTYTPVVTAFDGNLTAEKEIEITINDVDRPPVINLNERIVIDEQEELIIDLGDFISDPDDDRLSINVANLPPGATFINNKIKWQPDWEFVQRKGHFFTDFLNKLRLEKYFFFRNKEVDLSITACGKELCAERSLEIQINNINRKPALEEIEDITLTETETVFLKPFASDLDGDYVRYIFEEPFDSNGEWQTTYDDAGVHTVSVTVSDGYLTDTQEIKVTVLNKNHPPILEAKKLKLSGIDDVAFSLSSDKKDYFELAEGQPWSAKITATDPDNDNLTLWAEDIPQGASFNDQIFSWTPSLDVVNSGSEAQQFTVNFVASDGEFDVVHPITLVVKDVNRVPELISYSPTEGLVAEIDKPVTFSVVAADADEDSLSYKWDFGFWDSAVKGTNTIKRTFKTPGMKTVKVNIGDGSDSVDLTWKVMVKSSSVVEKTIEEKEEAKGEVSLEQLEEKELTEPKTEPVQPACPEPTPCPQPTVPSKAPFKVYVVSS